MRYSELPNLREVLSGIGSRADRLDETGAWPDEDLKVLTNLGAMRWAVPMRHGGEGLSALELHFRYEAIASVSITTALILTQRDSAIGMLSANENVPLAGELLEACASNAAFVTVGIAQLTTSRQRGAMPALRAEATPGGYVINGEIPWATGAAHARAVVIGATLSDSRQVLLILPMDLPGVSVDPHLPLVALRGSHTSTIRCSDVAIRHDAHVLLGPIPNVLATARRESLPIGQAFLASGLTTAAVNLIRNIDSDAARETQDRFDTQLALLRSDILEFCRPGSDFNGARGAELRGRSIDLAVRATHATVSLYKGAALLAGHPAQRHAREAMFLLVWSCPSPVVECTLAHLTSHG